MEQLMNSLTLILNKEIELILDTISEDYSINRQDLNKYLLNNSKKSNKQITSNVTDISVDSGNSICQGKTKKGDGCPNKAKPGTSFCGKHTP
jgi:hypothetical protein